MDRKKIRAKNAVTPIYDIADSSKVCWTLADLQDEDKTGMQEQVQFFKLRS